MQAALQVGLALIFTSGLVMYGVGALAAFFAAAYPNQRVAYVSISGLGLAAMLLALHFMI